jgi:F420-non-reducing hydrogenase iron-sulfur subunit
MGQKETRSNLLLRWYGGGIIPKFEPKILAFACNWCSYAGADLAGISRKQYPPNIRIIRVMCSGRVEPVFVLSAFENGADGVLITGCHPGDCHYKTGNKMAELVVGKLKELLSTLGIGGERLRLEWISASEGQRFAEIMMNFTTEVHDLGPNPMFDSGMEAEK